MYPALFQQRHAPRSRTTWRVLLAPARARNAEASTTPVLTIESDNAVTQWLELKRAYLQLRGEFAGKETGKSIPHTTNADVLQLATMWSRELAKVESKLDRDRSERARWQACVEDVEANADRAKPDDEYPRNEEFWQHASRRLAIYLQSRTMRPSRWSLAVESVKEAIAEVPSTLGHVTRSAASAAASVVKDPARLAAVLLGAAILLPPVIAAVRK